VLEPLLADGVDLDQERPAGESPPAAPVDESLTGGRERVGEDTWMQIDDVSLIPTDG
jgi:hypothetical protein